MTVAGDERGSTLASYLPQLVLRHLATARGTPSGPQAETFEAALLMIDISGFTALTEAAVRRGPAGTEELSRSLNGYLGRIIDLIVGHGGDIAKIVGDALIPVWPADGEDLATVARRAAACGLAVASSLGEATVEGELRLSLKVGICAGSLASTHVGGRDGRWLFLISGDAVSQLTELQPILRTGHVVASPAAWTHLADTFSGEPVGDGYVRLTGPSDDAVPARPLVPVPMSPDLESAARAYVPPVLLDRIEAGHADWLAELRRTTVVFTNVTGLTGARLDALRTLQSLSEAAQRVVARYDGWLKEITMDDKGTTLIGVFGVPPFSHEDDPARAVDSALALQGELGALGLGAGVGIATGPTFCGPVGNPKRRDFAMLGGHVNLAARLMQAAGVEEVLCDETTRADALVRHAFERLPAYVLKGLAMPVGVYRARVDAPAAGRTSALVDRTVEMEAASRRLAALSAGTGGSLLIEGEPGIGKSRLVEEWLARGRMQGVTGLIGTASEIDLSTPYHAWRGVFERLLGIEAVTDQAARRAIVLERLRHDPESARLAPLLAPVVSVDLPDNETTARLSGAVRADNTGDLLVGLIRRAAVEHPVLIVLEDAQWFDSASWSLVHRVRREIPEVLLVVTRRPVADAGASGVGGHEPGMERMRIGALASDDAVALAALRTGAERLADPVAAILRERAEGNPLFIEQLAFALRDAGRIVVDHGLLRTAPGVDELGRSIIPDTVQRVITSRLDQLPPAQALTLKVASVIGQRFAVRTLREIHPVPGEASAIEEHLEALSRLDLIAPTADAASEPTFEFRHKITQEVAYNLMPREQSRQLHLALAEWHERAYAADLSPYHAFLAHHWARADKPARAVHHLELAGAQALRTFANAEAVESLRQALALDAVSTPPVEPRRRARWHLQLGEADVHLSMYRLGREHLELGLRLMGRPVPAGRWRLAVAVLGQTVRQAFHRAGLGRDSERLTEAEREELVAACRAYERLAEAAYYGRSTLLPLYCAIRILNDAEASGSAPEIARGLAGTGVLFGLVPFPRIAERYLQDALARLADVDDLTTHEIVGIVVGFYYAGAGGWQIARERFTAVRTIAEGLGDRRRLLDALGNLGEIEYLRGSFRPATDLADRLVEVARAWDDRRFEWEAIAVQAYCAWQRGRSDEARRSIAGLRSIASEERDLPDELRIKLHGIDAVMSMDRGDLPSAVAASHEALRLAALQRPTYATFLGHTGPAEVFLDAWEAGQPVADAPARAAEAIGRLAGYARIFPIGRARHATLEGRRAWLSGRHAEAMRLWRAATATATTLSMPYEVGLARFEIGRHLGPGDAEGATHLAAARDDFERLGAARDARRVEAVLAGTATSSPA